MIAKPYRIPTLNTSKPLCHDGRMQVVWHVCVWGTSPRILVGDPGGTFCTSHRDQANACLRQTPNPMWAGIMNPLRDSGEAVQRDVELLPSSMLSKWCLDGHNLCPLQAHDHERKDVLHE
ncbi:hypothetical protein Ancab_020736 [Ancistrocladus abbreviatus]